MVVVASGVVASGVVVSEAFFLFRVLLVLPNAVREPCSLLTCVLCWEAHPPPSFLSWTGILVVPLLLPPQVVVVSLLLLFCCSFLFPLLFESLLQCP